MRVRLAGVIRKDTLLEERDQILEVASVHRWRTGDEVRLAWRGTYPPGRAVRDQRPMEPLTLSGILVNYQAENSVLDRRPGPRPRNDRRTLFVSCYGKSAQRDAMMAPCRAVRSR